MKFKEAVQNISTVLDLKRIASAYVIDYTRLGTDEIKAALVKTAPQYSHLENIKEAIIHMVINKERNIRVLGIVILKSILLNCDDFMSMQEETDNEILSYEQEIIREADQDLISNSNEIDQNYKLFRFVLSTAWDNNDEISPDEKNLIEKIRSRLNISDYEYNIIEAGIGKYPKVDNELHTKKEINTVRVALQKYGFLFSIRDSDGKDHDIIPEEIANSLRLLWNIEIRKYGYQEMIKSKYVRNKKYLFKILEKGNVPHNPHMKVEELQTLCIENITPTILLGGYNSRDGLDVASLSNWCQDLSLYTSGQKNELIQRITNHYDMIRKRPDENILDDERSLLFDYYKALASRDLTLLRHQQIINKDIDCERYFEQATNYLFEKYLGHKPLVMKGTEHPDGILSFNDKLIYWDNKSKESPVNLSDHIKQFDRYIRASEKPVASFVVIGPAFTTESIKECKKYSMMNNTTICLITAKQLKDIALKWVNENAFPLQYFRQLGLFDSDIIDF